jgi:hypothetical protein
MLTTSLTTDSGLADGTGIVEGDGAAAGGDFMMGEFGSVFTAPAEVEDMVLRKAGAGGPTISLRLGEGEGTVFPNLGADVDAAFRMMGEGEAIALTALGEGEGSGFMNAVEDDGTNFPDKACNRFRFVGADFVGLAFAVGDFKLSPGVEPE